MDEFARERARAQQDPTSSGFSPTYQVRNTANVALLANHVPVYSPYITQSVQSHWSQTGIPLTPQQESQVHGKAPKCTVTDVSIRVINPERKRDAKMFILKSIELTTFRTVKGLREEILEQLGKNVVSFQLDFDISYMTGNQRICFRERDEIAPQLLKLAENGSQLWCEGLTPRSLKSRKRPTRPTSASIIIEWTMAGLPKHIVKKKRYQLWTRRLKGLITLRTSCKPNMEILSTEFSISYGQRL